MPNYLGIPKYADDVDLQNYCRTRDTIRRFQAQWQQGYDNYAAYFGRPFRAWQFAQALPVGAAKRMQGLYRSDIPVAKLIKLRLSQKQGLNYCPYCGLQKNVTSDHYLPQAHFPQYAVFSRNLVPSCSDCQSAAAKHDWFPGFTSRGGQPKRRPAGRLLHPYFDRFLRRRVLRIDFQPAEIISGHNFAAIVKDPAQRRLIEFHVHKMNISENADTTIRTFWTALLKDIRRNPQNATDLEVLKRYLDGEMQKLLDRSFARNSVEYVFYCSIRADVCRLQFLIDAARAMHIAPAAPPTHNVPIQKGPAFK